MQFAEKMEIRYKDMVGTISFIGDSYITVSLPAVNNRNSAKLIVYREDFNLVKSFKDSEK